MMKTRNGWAIFIAVIISAACASGRDGPPDSPAPYGSGEVVPRQEPRSSSGNPPFYDAFGQRYYVMDSNEGYVERGVASWYGRKFHGRNTANGEIFDMYAMTAAHKTLPLPTYAQVTNLRNGKSITVRINDRGPFVHNRLIDVSWSAARQLGFEQDGTTLVEVRVVGGAEPVPAAAVARTAEERAITDASAEPAPEPEPDPVEETEIPASANQVFLQVGAFADYDNAERLRDRLETRAIQNVVIHDRDNGAQRLYKVRIGPVKSVDAFDGLIDELNKIGIHEAHLAVD